MAKQGIPEKFYKRDLDTYDLTSLLCASPFSNKSILNFNHTISESIFFDHIYTERVSDDRISSDIKKENDDFDNDMNSAIKNLGNDSNHVQLIRICGYGGCGKTTYVRHLLWLNKDKYKLENSIINYEGAKYAKTPIIKHLASIIGKYHRQYLRFLNDLLTQNRFDLSVFEDYLPFTKNLYRSISYLFGNYKNPEEYQIKTCISKTVNSIKGDENSKPIRQLRFLVLMEYFYLLFHQLVLNATTCSLLIDNIDNLDNTTEEVNLVSAIRLEASDINAFIDNNLDNNSPFLNKAISKHLLNKKLVLFLTTRIVTEARIQEIAPDNEIEFGWNKYLMPSDYYSQRDILFRIADYYINAEKKSPNTKTVEQLKRIKELIPAIYVSNYYKKIFNGNIRYSKHTLRKFLELYKDDQSLNIINETIDLYKLAEAAPNDLSIREGLNGIILSMILFYFKKEGIYSDKLNLSECSDHETISISRVILTILRENENEGFSLYQLFELLNNIDNTKYSLVFICDVLYSLSEAKRTFWRRLLIFENHYPESVKDLYIQAKQFEAGNKNIADYSNIRICTAGITYLDLVIPHFEFMASRLNRKKRMEIASSPLFCKNSLDKYNGTYNFDSKISGVFDAVKECCRECSDFSKKVMTTKGYTKERYAESFFNYRVEYKDGNRGYRQCYESRLIFRHVGYIEKYRQYILKTNMSMGEKELRTINEKLVSFIKNYLLLYTSSGFISYKTINQNNAASKMLEIIKNKFENTEVPYSDFTSHIES